MASRAESPIESLKEKVYEKPFGSMASLRQKLQQIAVAAMMAFEEDVRGGELRPQADMTQEGSTSTADLCPLVGQPAATDPYGYVGHIPADV